VPDSRAEVAALHSIIGALHACRIFDADSRGGAFQINILVSTDGYDVWTAVCTAQP
jgi:hypothetical protein